MPTQLIRIDKEVHTKLAKYCKDNCLRQGDFVSKIIKDFIKKNPDLFDRNDK